MKSNRRFVRERVLQALYAYEVSQQPIPFLIERNFSDFQNNVRDFEFAKTLLASVIEHKLEFDKFLQSKTKHWEVDRLALIDKILMWMGMCEIEYFDDIPPKVSINEMIEISKKFSTEESGKFINGILDVFFQELKAKGIFIKRGRGLYEATLGANSKEKLILETASTENESGNNGADIRKIKKKKFFKKVNPPSS